MHDYIHQFKNGKYLHSTCKRPKCADREPQHFSAIANMPSDQQAQLTRRRNTR